MTARPRPVFTSLGVEISADRYAVWVALAGEDDRGAVVELLDPVDPFTVDPVEHVDALRYAPAITAVVLNPAGNGATLVDPLRARGVSLLLPDASGMSKAWGIFHDRTVAGTLKHRGHRDLTEAARLAVARRTAGGRSRWTGGPVRTPRRWSRLSLRCTGSRPAVGGRNCTCGPARMRQAELVTFMATCDLWADHRDTVSRCGAAEASGQGHRTGASHSRRQRVDRRKGQKVLQD